MTTNSEARTALITAQHKVQHCINTLDRVRADCIALVATELPGRFDQIAKEFVHREPHVTLDLGAGGVRTLRSDLDAVARREAVALRTVPMGDFAWDDTSEANRFSSLARPFGARLADGLLPDVKKILDSAGYISARHLRSAPKDSTTVECGAYPASGICLTEYPPIGDAFTDLWKAEHDLHAKRQAYEQAQVVEIWANSTPTPTPPVLASVPPLP